ncbi:hypothetical protein NY416_07490 [Enterobacter hormaechei]|uniref:hypothetical protein n=1 Tax=Enterobacter hormaechei TaxID=158836 RepID=UPI0022F0B3FC|nr:hypothetical protein [Enterobacter hormaechei]MDA4719808.1 hypothetical protein [Enterobacter hormaechei]MDE7607581.1 hypothetical protein [Enterobacter hormaechei]HCJ1575898.1 hypothetical protein [Enterobacter hormaechei]
MFAFLIIPLLVSGFIVITTHPFHFFRLHRYDGQLLYMKAAKYGLWCLVWSVFIAFIIKYYFPSAHLVTDVSQSLGLGESLYQKRITGWLIFLSCTSVLLAWLSGVIANWFTTLRSQMIYRFFYKKDISIEESKELVKLRTLQDLVTEGSMDSVFFDSLIDRKSILVSMTNKKVYVGIVNALGEPNEKDGPNQQISILPIMSGYRDKDTLNVCFTNDYNNIEGYDTSVIIPVSQITQVSWFTMEVHDQVNNNCKGQPE